ncbi:unnamed protein product [Rangifer tarandus platyrhynchus]|uniref:Uncharacterized protein n=1 Tax=Rangifer tarandus platyrhynchus TaxID=3082113 RepID=A0ACB1MJT4_RANTA
MSAAVLKAPVHLYKRRKSSEISTACVLQRLTPTVENMVLEITALLLLDLADNHPASGPESVLWAQRRTGHGFPAVMTAHGAAPDELRADFTQKR